MNLFLVTLRYARVCVCVRDFFALHFVYEVCRSLKVPQEDFYGTSWETQNIDRQRGNKKPWMLKGIQEIVSIAKIASNEEKKVTANR